MLGYRVDPGLPCSATRSKIVISMHGNEEKMYEIIKITDDRRET